MENSRFYLQLVNRQNPWMLENKSNHLVKAPCTDDNKELYLDIAVVKHLTNLIEDLQLTNKIIIVDGYRTIAEQTALWEFSLQERGEKYTNDYVAYPGCSEHHTGLAFDIGLKKTKHDVIAPKFQGVEAEKFLKSMKNYGFILRYPPNKQAITGIAYEPWHFRYVGVPHSQIIMDRNWTLEEYTEFLTQVGGLVS